MNTDPNIEPGTTSPEPRTPNPEPRATSPGPKTVLLLTPSVRLLGARRSLLALATHLDRARWRPIVLAKEEGVMTGKLRAAGVGVRIIHFRPYRKGKYFIFRPFTIWKLRRIAREENAALMHCNEIYPNPYAVRAAAPLALPVVTHMRLSVTPEMTPKYLLERADRIIVVSNAAGECFNHWPDKERKVTVIYNGLDLEEWSPRPGAREQWRRRWEVGDNEILFGMMSLISDRKQQHVAIEAMRLLRAQGLPARLIIVGEVSPREGAYEQRLRAMVREYNLEGAVRFEPFQEDPVPVFQALDANILISTDEGFGRVIIEAGALGIPTIGSRIGGIPELIAPEQDGLLIAAGDAPALAEAMRRLLDSALRRAMGDAARKKAQERFSIEAHARQVEALYEQVIDARR
ncbi:MAG: glycosyltransferase family 4 protein [Candidatus Sumerlaeota bacterium]|nr:glycosyltransferase family 4 protein [Candidatus Sumerlaeota bacterium]